MKMMAFQDVEVIKKLLSRYLPWDSFFYGVSEEKHASGHRNFQQNLYLSNLS
jgi:hypothetical protein